MEKAQALLFKALFDAKGTGPYGENSNLFLGKSVGLEGNRQLAARYVIEDAGHTEAGWKLFRDVLHKICANFEDVMCKALFFLTKSRLRYPRFQRGTFCDGLQLISANSTEKGQKMLASFVSRQLKPEFVRTDLLVVLALQETRSSDTDDMHVPGFVLYGSTFALTTLLISEQVFRVQRS